MSRPTIRCTACGAGNLEGAAWCGQCYADLSIQQDASPMMDDDLREAVGAVVDGVEGRDSSERKASGWECRFCGTPNPVSSSECIQCYMSIFDSFGAERRKDIDVPPIEALKFGAVFPGGGLLKVEEKALGIVVAALTVFCFGAALGLFVGGVYVMGALLMATGVGVWLVAVRDAMAFAAGRPDGVWLSMRVLTIISLVAAALFGIALAQVIGGLRRVV